MSRDRKFHERQLIPVPDGIRGNALRGAYRKGVQAARAGAAESANPYRQSRPKFAEIWLQGWLAGGSTPIG